MRSSNSHACGRECGEALDDRRRGTILSLALLAIPTLALAFAPNLAVFATLRIVQGLCMASAFTLTLAYLGEQCSARYRWGIRRLYHEKCRVKDVEVALDAVLKKPVPADEAERMFRSLVDMRAIGPGLATLLVREAFSRPIANRRALGSYVGLVGTPFSSGGSEREQGIGKDGNRRVRAAMVELAWLWLRWQPDSTLSAWFRERVGKAGVRIKKIMIVALARKLLIALWRDAKDGVIVEGAKMKMA